MFQCFREGARVEFHHEVEAGTIIAGSKVFEAPVVALRGKIKVKGWGFLLFAQKRVADVLTCREVAASRVVWPEEMIQNVEGGDF